MNTNIEAPKSVKEDVYIAIRSKMDKLDNYFDRIEASDVYLKREQKDSVKGKVVEIKLIIPGPDLFTSAGAETYEKAFATAFNKMKKLLVETKNNRFNPRYKPLKEL